MVTELISISSSKVIVGQIRVKYKKSSWQEVYTVYEKKYCHNITRGNTDYTSVLSRVDTESRRVTKTLNLAM